MEFSSNIINSNIESLDQNNNSSKPKRNLKQNNPPKQHQPIQQTGLLKNKLNNISERPNALESNSNSRITINNNDKENYDNDDQKTLPNDNNACPNNNITFKDEITNINTDNSNNRNNIEKKSSKNTNANNNNIIKTEILSEYNTSSEPLNQNNVDFIQVTPNSRENENKGDLKSKTIINHQGYKIILSDSVRKPKL